MHCWQGCFSSSFATPLQENRWEQWWQQCVQTKFDQGTSKTSCSGWHPAIAATIGHVHGCIFPLAYIGNIHICGEIIAFAKNAWFVQLASISDANCSLSESGVHVRCVPQTSTAKVDCYSPAREIFSMPSQGAFTQMAMAQPHTASLIGLTYVHNQAQHPFFMAHFLPDFCSTVVIIQAVFLHIVTIEEHILPCYWSHLIGCPLQCIISTSLQSKRLLHLNAANACANFNWKPCNQMTRNEESRQKGGNSTATFGWYDWYQPNRT